MNNNVSKERQISISVAEENLQIQGVLRGETSWPLAILAPGLGGWMHDLLLFNASRYFEQRAIATLRVSFYGNDKSQRNIGDFDVRTSAADIDTVVAYARQAGHEWVCVVGHSYSGMAIVYSRQQRFDAAVLWDPSHTDGYDDPQAAANLVNDFVYIKELDSYVSSKGPGYVISRKVFKNYAPGSTAMALDFGVKTLVVNASNSAAMIAYGKNYADSIATDAEHIVILGSSHSFTEDGAMKKLYKTTASWILRQANQ